MKQRTDQTNDAMGTGSIDARIAVLENVQSHDVFFQNICDWVVLTFQFSGWLDETATLLISKPSLGTSSAGDVFWAIG
jgi:hypothetical protein